MQTSITADMVYGFPGEVAKDQPYVADTFVCGADVTIGSLVKLDGNGNVIAVTSSDTTALGIAIGAHQHIRDVLPKDSRAITVANKQEVGVLRKGCVYVNLPTNATEKAKWKIGAKLAITSGALAQSDNGTVGEVVEVGGLLPTALTNEATVALIRIDL